MPRNDNLSTLSFAERAILCSHPLGKRLFTYMSQKQSNLALAADVTQAKELLHLAKTTGPHICVFKTHIDITEDYTPALTEELKKIADSEGFILFEDRKFADIGNTALYQYTGGIYRICDWASLTNAHPLPGPGIVEALRKAGQPRGNGLLLIAQLSSQGNLIDEDYTQHAVQLAQEFSDFVIGFIAQERVSEDPRMIHMTPGVQFAKQHDPLGQQYNTPEYVIGIRGADVAIVGRGITQEANPKSAAREYQLSSWQAYEQRLSPQFS